MGFSSHSPSPPNNEMAGDGERSMRPGASVPMDRSSRKGQRSRYTRCSGFMGREVSGPLGIPISNRHVPQSQAAPPQTSPDLEHLPGKAHHRAQKEQVLNCPFLQGFPSILLALPYPPHATLPRLFPLTFPLLFPLFTGLPPPPPVPPLAFSPLCSLSYSLCYSLPLLLPSWCEWERHGF